MKCCRQSVRRRCATTMMVLAVLCVVIFVTLSSSFCHAAEPEYFRDDKAKQQQQQQNPPSTTPPDMRVRDDPLTAAIKPATTRAESLTKPQQQQLSTASTKEQQQKAMIAEDELEVIQLTTRTFSRAISDGNIWLIEFYSPACSHCEEFAPVYSDIAMHYHTKNVYAMNDNSANKTKTSHRKVKVARINGPFERALVSRFNLYAYPQFFLIDGYNVYEYDTYSHVRSKTNIIQYVDGAYLQTDPVPFYTSPMGPIGILQGTIIRTVYIIYDIYAYINVTIGLGPMITGMIFFGTIFVCSFLSIVFVALMIPPKHSPIKID